MSAPRTVLGLVVASGLLLGGGVAAGALAATGALAAQPTASPSGAPGLPGMQGRHRGDGGPGGLRGPLGGRGQVLHGEVVVAKAGGGTETLLVQHGTVTAKTADTVTVRSTDGFTKTWKVTSTTTVRAGRHAGQAPGQPGAAAQSLADVAEGADVVVLGPATAGDPTARMLGVRPAGGPGGPDGMPGWRDGGGHRDRGPGGAPTAPPAPGTATTAPGTA